MSNRWFNLGVIGLWLGSMSWLFVAKILPPLLIGQPPSYQNLLATPDRNVAWRILWNGREVGTASSSSRRKEDGLGELTSTVHLTELPLLKMTPPWLAPLVGDLDALAELDVHAESRIDVDPLGQLLGMESTLKLGAMAEEVHMRGWIEGGLLNLQVSYGEFAHTTSTSLPQTSLVSDALSPQGWLPNLRVGQNWTAPIYSPFRPRSKAVEILEAAVEREEWIVWQGRTVACLVVVYRSDAGAGGSGDRTRGKVWVRRDGLVLRQEVDLLGSQLVFERVPDDADTREVVAAAGDGQVDD